MKLGRRRQTSRKVECCVSRCFRKWKSNNKRWSASLQLVVIAVHGCAFPWSTFVYTLPFYESARVHTVIRTHCPLVSTLHTRQNLEFPPSSVTLTKPPQGGAWCGKRPTWGHGTCVQIPTLSLAAGTVTKLLRARRSLCPLQVVVADLNGIA